MAWGSSSRCLSLSLWVSQMRRAACPGRHCPHPAQVTLPGSQELCCLTGTPVLTWRPCAYLTGRCWLVQQCLHRPHPSRSLPAALYLYLLLTCTCRAPRLPVAASPGPDVRVESPLLIHLQCSSLASCPDTALSGTTRLLARAPSPWPLLPRVSAGLGLAPACAVPGLAGAVLWGRSRPPSPLTQAGPCGSYMALSCFTQTSDPAPRRLQGRPGNVACHSSCDTCKAGSKMLFPGSLNRLGMPMWLSRFSVSCFAGGHSLLLAWKGQPCRSVPVLLLVLSWPCAQLS